MTDKPPFEKPDAFSLALNYVPLVHVAGGIALALSLSGWNVFWCLLAWIYLLPPLIGRITLMAFGVPQGELSQGMRAYRVWWFLTQWQMLFNRLPMLEELLRLVPGLYPLWIALWGGRLSQMAFVAPRVLITDRYLVNVGRGAILGFHSALVGHMAIRDAQGRFVVVVATPTVESEAIVGGYAQIGPGALLRRGHLLPSGRRVGPLDEYPRRAREELPT